MDMNFLDYQIEKHCMHEEKLGEGCESTRIGIQSRLDIAIYYIPTVCFW